MMKNWMKRFCTFRFLQKTFFNQQLQITSRRSRALRLLIIEDTHLWHTFKAHILPNWKNTTNFITMILRNKVAHLFVLELCQLELSGYHSNWLIKMESLVQIKDWNIFSLVWVISPNVCSMSNLHKLNSKMFFIKA